MTKFWKNITDGNFFKIFLWSKTAIYLSLGIHKVCPSYRRSLQLSKEAIQHFKTWTFTNFCLLLWVIFALLEPEPDPDSESGSTDPIEYGSNPDPDPDLDPQPCMMVLKPVFRIQIYGIMKQIEKSEKFILCSSLINNCFTVYYVLDHP